MKDTFAWVARRGIALLLPLIAASLSSSSSVAQAEESPENFQTPGFKLGERFRLHPQFESSAGYSSNVFLDDSNVQGSALVRAGAALRIRTADAPGSAQKFRFDAALRADYLEVLEAGVRDNVTSGAKIGLVVNPQGHWRFLLSDDFSRTALPFTRAGAIDDDYVINTNEITLGVEGASTEDVLVGRLTYGFGFRIFEGASFDFANQLRHKVSLLNSWKFLQNSSVRHESEYEFTDVYNFDASAATTTALLSDAHRIQSTLGLVTAINPLWSYSLSLGYAAGYATVGSLTDRGTVVGNAELRYSRQRLSLAAGLKRDLVISMTSRSQVQSGGEVKAGLQLGSRVNLRARFNVNYVEFGQFLAADGSLIDPNRSEREDVTLGATFGADVIALSWLSFFTEASYRQVITDFVFQRDPDSTSAFLDPAEFAQFVAWGGVRLKY